MNLTNRKVLVTGAAGFIGSHLTQRLLQEGADVRAMTHYRGDPSLHNLEFLPREELQKLEVIRGDITDSSFVRTAVSGCDYVFHLAALIGIPYSYIAPNAYVATNIIGTMNVLEACRDHHVTRVVHTSTSECYGTAQYTPIDEKHPLQGQSPYSASKIGADKLAESYYRAFNTPVVTVRPFNTYGPRQSARAVIPTIFSQIYSQSKEIRLGNLDAKRDLTFVLDSVRAFLLAATTPDLEGETIHFGSGKAISIRELAQLCIDISEKDVYLSIDKNRLRPAKSEVDLLLCNPARANQLMHWKPETSLREGLAQVAAFVKSHRSLFPNTKYTI